MDEYSNLQKVKDAVRGNLNKYTRRALDSLPVGEISHILDIGCGSGVPTIELATLSQAKIIAIDNDRLQLELLAMKLKEQGLEHRIETICCSIDKMKFRNENFDLIWSEGSIYPVGFQKGLKEWRRLLKPVGYMGIHDERGDVGKKLKLIAGCGYELLDHFVLDRDIWWNEYYSPLERELFKLQETRYKDTGISPEFRKELQEIEFFNNHPERCESVFFVLQKSNSQLR
jgi:ubiquinone/menaquinone biosynthesis C-methylase UbiE